MIDFIYDFRLLPLGNEEVSQSIRMWLCGVLPVYPLQRAIAIIIIAEALIINYAFAATRPEGNSWPFITVATRRTCSTLIVRPADTDEAAEPYVPRFGVGGNSFSLRTGNTLPTAPMETHGKMEKQNKQSKK